MTVIQWPDRFGTEEACRAYLYLQRWPHGFVCPQGRGTQWWTVHRSGWPGTLYECRACGHQDSVTERFFHRTKVPLRGWFVAMFLIAVDKGGQSTVALGRELGLRHATARLLHHKIQCAMTDRNAQYQLGGVVDGKDSLNWLLVTFGDGSPASRRT